MGFEANTGRIKITPKLKADGWDSAPLSLFKHHTSTDVLKVRLLSDHGYVNETIGSFAGANLLRNAVNQPQSLLYAA